MLEFTITTLWIVVATSTINFKFSEREHFVSSSAIHVTGICYLNTISFISLTSMHVYLHVNDVRRIGNARICNFSKFPLLGISKHICACCRTTVMCFENSLKLSLWQEESLIFYVSRSLLSTFSASIAARKKIDVLDSDTKLSVNLLPV